MSKAAIVTIYDPSPNYGNKLQNYASKAILERYGLSVRTLVSEPQPTIQSVYAKYILNGLCRNRLRGQQAQLAWKKYIAFYRFSQKYLNPSTAYIDGTLKTADYDYYVIGSDQVWNAEWYDSYEKKKDIFLLTFAEPEQMICMVPSFGVDALPDKWNDWFAEKLSRFPHLNVREEAGVTIIKNLTSKEAEVMIDPTMMLDAEEWLKIAVKPKHVDLDKPYILTYILGNTSERLGNDIERFSKEYNLSVHKLNDYSEPDAFVSDPSEFIYLIANADLILTDSFHACVFSFLFSKPFLVYQREGNTPNMMSRINTLLDKFSLQRKFVESGLHNELFESDYETGFQKLQQEREKLDGYLKAAIQDIDGKVCQ